MKRFLRWFLFSVICLSGLFILGIIGHVQLKYGSKQISELQIYEKKSFDAIVILGASPMDNGELTALLEDRLRTGFKLYQMNMSPHLVISGDDGMYRRNEINPMKIFLEGSGVSSSALLIDPRGYRTYETCRRARDEYHFSRILLVTQSFHMRRALFLCNEMGLDASGVVADHAPLDRPIFYWTRDLLASFLAWVDINVRHPAPPVILYQAG